MAPLAKVHVVQGDSLILEYDPTPGTNARTAGYILIANGSKDDSADNSSTVEKTKNLFGTLNWLSDSARNPSGENGSLQALDTVVVVSGGDDSVTGVKTLLDSLTADAVDPNTDSAGDNSPDKLEWFQGTKLVQGKQVAVEHVWYNSPSILDAAAGSPTPRAGTLDSSIGSLKFNDDLNEANLPNTTWKKATTALVWAGQTATTGKQVTKGPLSVEFLGPVREDVVAAALVHKPGSSVKTPTKPPGSIAFSAQMQDASILFLGDNSAQTVLWPKYKAANAVLKYDIVQVANHGRSSFSCWNMTPERTKEDKTTGGPLQKKVNYLFSKVQAKKYIIITPEYLDPTDSCIPTIIGIISAAHETSTNVNIHLTDPLPAFAAKKILTAVQQNKWNLSNAAQIHVLLSNDQTFGTVEFSTDADATMWATMKEDDFSDYDTWVKAKFPNFDPSKVPSQPEMPPRPDTTVQGIPLLGAHLPSLSQVLRQFYTSLSGLPSDAPSTVPTQIISTFPGLLNHLVAQAILTPADIAQFQSANATAPTDLQTMATPLFGTGATTFMASLPLDSSAGAATAWSVSSFAAAVFNSTDPKLSGWQSVQAVNFQVTATTATNLVWNIPLPHQTNPFALHMSGPINVVVYWPCYENRVIYGQFSGVLQGSSQSINVVGSYCITANNTPKYYLRFADASFDTINYHTTFKDIFTVFEPSQLQSKIPQSVVAFATAKLPGLDNFAQKLNSALTLDQAGFMLEGDLSSQTTVSISQVFGQVIFPDVKGWKPFGNTITFNVPRFGVILNNFTSFKDLQLFLSIDDEIDVGLVKIPIRFESKPSSFGPKLYEITLLPTSTTTIASLFDIPGLGSFDIAAKLPGVGGLANSTTISNATIGWVGGNPADAAAKFSVKPSYLRCTVSMQDWAVHDVFVVRALQADIQVDDVTSSTNRNVILRGQGEVDVANVDVAVAFSIGKPVVLPNQNVTQSDNQILFSLSTIGKRLTLAGVLEHFLGSSVNVLPSFVEHLLEEPAISSIYLVADKSTNAWTISSIEIAVALSDNSAALIDNLVLEYATLVITIANPFDKARTTNVVLNAMTDLSGTAAQLKVALTGGATDTITASLTGGTNGVSLNALFGQFFPSSGTSNLKVPPTLVSILDSSISNATITMTAPPQGKLTLTELNVSVTDATSIPLYNGMAIVSFTLAVTYNKTDGAKGSLTGALTLDGGADTTSVEIDSTKSQQGKSLSITITGGLLTLRSLLKGFIPSLDASTLKVPKEASFLLDLAIMNADATMTTGADGKYALTTLDVTVSSTQNLTLWDNFGLTGVGLTLKHAQDTGTSVQLNATLDLAGGKAQIPFSLTYDGTTGNTAASSASTLTATATFTSSLSTTQLIKQICNVDLSGVLGGAALSVFHAVPDIQTSNLSFSLIKGANNESCTLSGQTDFAIFSDLRVAFVKTDAWTYSFSFDTKPNSNLLDLIPKLGHQISGALSFSDMAIALYKGQLDASVLPAAFASAKFVTLPKGGSEVSLAFAGKLALSDKLHILSKFLDSAEVSILGSISDETLDLAVHLGDVTLMGGAIVISGDLIVILSESERTVGIQGTGIFNFGSKVSSSPIQTSLKLDVDFTVGALGYDFKIVQWEGMFGYSGLTMKNVDFAARFAPETFPVPEYFAVSGELDLQVNAAKFSGSLAFGFIESDIRNCYASGSLNGLDLANMAQAFVKTPVPAVFKKFDVGIENLSFKIVPHTMTDPNGNVMKQEFALDGTWVFFGLQAIVNIDITDTSILVDGQVDPIVLAGNPKLFSILNKPAINNGPFIGPHVHVDSKNLSNPFLLEGALTILGLQWALDVQIGDTGLYITVKEPVVDFGEVTLNATISKAEVAYSLAFDFGLNLNIPTFSIAGVSFAGVKINENLAIHASVDFNWARKIYQMIIGFHINAFGLNKDLSATLGSDGEDMSHIVKAVEDEIIHIFAELVQDALKVAKEAVKWLEDEFKLGYNDIAKCLTGLGRDIGDVIREIHSLGKATIHDLAQAARFAGATADKAAAALKSVGAKAGEVEDTLKKAGYAEKDVDKALKGAFSDAERGVVGAADTVAHGTVGAANTVAHGTIGAANTIAHGTVGAANTVAHGTVGAANTVAHGTVDAANKVADGAKKAANTVGDAFKHAFHF